MAEVRELEQQAAQLACQIEQQQQQRREVLAEIVEVGMAAPRACLLHARQAACLPAGCNVQSLWLASRYLTTPLLLTPLNVQVERAILLWERKIQLEREIQEALDPGVGNDVVRAGPLLARRRPALASPVCAGTAQCHRQSRLSLGVVADRVLPCCFDPTCLPPSCRWAP